MSKIDVIITPTEQPSYHFENTTAVVIDVLRAASSICTAFANGCTEIIPVAEIEDAWKAAEIFPRPLVLLAGERNGRKISGFDLGNSPKEFQAAVVAGKTIVMTTSHGTRSLLMAAAASRVLILSLLNLRSVTNALRHTEQDIVIVCAGLDKHESLEDTVCAGLLVERLQDLETPPRQITETARTALALARQYKIDLLAMLQASAHGEYLDKIGFSDDLEICSRVNAFDVTPVYEDGSIRSITGKTT
jgi:2-phosphosulfolactate phosphatase